MDKKYALDAFSSKFLFCGDYVVYKDYSLPFLIGVPKSDKFGVKNFDNSSSTPKRYDSLKRSRDTVAAYVYCNLTPHTKFMTLTTKDTVLDVKPFMRMITTFLQAMKRKGYDLDYLYVLERQKERGEKEGNSGSLHAHFIVFNDEKIDMSILKKCWHYGRVELKILDGLRVKDGKKSEELIRNPASYVCKYITKESVAEWNEKVFRCSKGLKKPVEINGKGYLTDISYTRSEECESLRNFVYEDYLPIYQTSKTARYTTDSGSKTNFIEVTVAKRKELQK